MEPKTTFTYKLTAAQQDLLESLLSSGNYRPAQVPYTRIAVKAPDCSINLYTSGKLVVQGKGAEEFIIFTLEPIVLQRATLGYDTVVNPEAVQPHIGVDESGKGDFFGPLVIAGVYIHPGVAGRMREMDVRDSKTISSDRKAMAMGAELRKMLGPHCTIIKIGPATYNRLYAKMRNVNTLLSWGHARAIENLLEVVPDCPRAISDQFGRKDQVERALMTKGRRIELIQMPRAESDLAVAAASIVAREAFLRALHQMKERFGIECPKGASPAVTEAARDMVRKSGAKVLIEAAKCHFRTADQVLESTGHSRAELGPDGAVVSKIMRPCFGKRPSKPAGSDEASPS
jgi:ribonuclease HIII